MRIFKKIFISGILLTVLIFIIGFSIKWYADKYCFKDSSKIPNCTVGIVFGAGIKNGVPSKYLKDRLDAGIDLYKKGKVKKLILSGDNGRDEYDEVSVMKEYCYSNNVDSNDIFVDYAGFDTYSTLYRAKHIFKVDSAILISQQYHLGRAVFTGRNMGLTVFGYAADNGSYGNYLKSKIREYPAIINAIIELIRHRKPKYLGEEIDVIGESNFGK